MDRAQDISFQLVRYQKLLFIFSFSKDAEVMKGENVNTFAQYRRLKSEQSSESLKFLAEWYVRKLVVNRLRKVIVKRTGF